MRDEQLLTRAPYPRHRERERLNALIDDVLIGHVGFVTETGEPHVDPVAVARRGNDLVWRGPASAASLLPPGSGRVSVCLSSIEAVVVGRSRLRNSLWYRSAVLYGTPRRLEGMQLVCALDTLTEHVLPGRLEETRPVTGEELAATAVFALPITDWVFEESAQWPHDGVHDLATPVWAGMVPMLRRYGEAVPAPGLDPLVEVPVSCLRLIQAGDDLDH